MKLLRAAIFTLVLSENLSRFNTLNCRLAFLYIFNISSLKVTALSILIPNNLTDSSFSNLLCSVKVGAGLKFSGIDLHYLNGLTFKGNMYLLIKLLTI